MHPVCEQCKIYETCESCCISGRGSDKPDIIFIGEAPGFEEDKKGRPFVGPAGRLLMDRLQKAELNQYNLRFTNVVRCFPNIDNTTRHPRKKEVTLCLPFLYKELSEFPPSRLVVPLGRTAFHALAGKSKSITQWGGMTIRNFDAQKETSVLSKIPMIPCIHPAAVLRQRNNRRVFLSHLQSIKSFMETKSRKRYKFNSEELKKVISIKRWVRSSIEKKHPTAFDYETTGLDSWESDVICVSLYDTVEDRVVLINFDGPLLESKKKCFAEWLASDVPKIAHNAKFEIRWSIHHFYTEPNNLVDDTMLLHSLLEEESMHKLSYLACRYTNFGGYDNWMEEWKESGKKIHEAPKDELIKYSIGDAVATGIIQSKLVKIIKKDKVLLRLYNDAVLPLSFVLARMEERGFAVDEKRLSECEKELKVQASSIMKSVNTHNVVRQTLKRCKIDPVVGINLNSTKQVRILMYDVLKLPILRYTDGGKPSTKKEVVEALSDKHPILANITKVRSIQHDLGLTEQIRERLRPNGTVSVNWNQGHVLTGRLSCSKFNAQAIGRESIIRSALVSRFPGGKVLAADFEQLELMLVANEAKEEAMIKVFKAGGDIHGTTATLLFGKNYDNEQRTQSKRVNFGVIYGIGAKELAWQIKRPQDYGYAKRLLRKHKEAYPRVSAYIEAQREHARRKGYVRSRMGRIRRLPDANSEDRSAEIKALLQAGNFPIQSFAAEITAWAMIESDRELRQRRYESVMIGQIHDSILFDVHKKEIKRVSRLIERIMTKDMMKKFPFFLVPLKVDVKISDTW